MGELTLCFCTATVNSKDISGSQGGCVHFFIYGNTRGEGDHYLFSAMSQHRRPGKGWVE